MVYSFLQFHLNGLITEPLDCYAAVDSRFANSESVALPQLFRILWEPTYLYLEAANGGATWTFYVKASTKRLLAG